MTTSNQTKPFWVKLFIIVAIIGGIVAIAIVGMIILLFGAKFKGVADTKYRYPPLKELQTDLSNKISFPDSTQLFIDSRERESNIEGGSSSYILTIYGTMFYKSTVARFYEKQLSNLGWKVWLYDLPTDQIKQLSVTVGHGRGWCKPSRSFKLTFLDENYNLSQNVDIIKLKKNYITIYQTQLNGDSAGVAECSGSAN